MALEHLLTIINNCMLTVSEVMNQLSLNLYCDQYIAMWLRNVKVCIALSSLVNQTTLIGDGAYRLEIISASLLKGMVYSVGRHDLFCGSTDFVDC